MLTYLLLGINFGCYVNTQGIQFITVFVGLAAVYIVFRFSTVYQFSYRNRSIFYLILLIFIGYVGCSVGWSYKNGKDASVASVYEFNTKELYEQCYFLYEESEEQTYVILSYSDTVLELRELTSSRTEVVYFDNKQECNEFIDSQTMGKEVYVPELSGGCKFSQEQLSVSYHPVLKESDEKLIEQKNSISFQSGFYTYVIILIAINFMFNFMTSRKTK